MDCKNVWVTGGSRSRHGLSGGVEPKRSESRRGAVSRGGALRRLVAACAIGAAAFCVSPSSSRAAEQSSEHKPSVVQVSERPVATELRVDDTGDSAKLIFALSAPVEATGFTLARPDRVVVDLPRVDFAVDPRIGRPARPAHRRAHGADPRKLVAAFRFGWLGQDTSRVVVDLGAPARIVAVRCETGPDEGHALVIELARTDRASFRAAAQRARATIAERAPEVPSGEPPALAGKAVVVIDPGHGGIDSGAIVNGLTEKTLVLEFANDLAAKLEADGRFSIVMTRKDDSFVPLADRVKIARESNGSLFVSLHADTLSDSRDVAGATVYTVSERASDAEAQRVAAKENEADAAAGLEANEDASDVSDILHDLTRRETRAMSHIFARTLLNYWKVAGRLNKNPQRSAGFRVLKAPDVPSVLLELGYLSNRDDDVALSSSDWRDKAAGEVAQAIVAYFSAREGSVASTVAGERKPRLDRAAKDDGPIPRPEADVPEVSRE